MSLIQLFDDPLDFYRRPSRILDQRFGLGLEPEDILSPFMPRDLRSVFHNPAGYVRQWRPQSAMQEVGSTVSFDKDRFQANLDVQHFKPEEIAVKIIGDNTVLIEGKHEEKQDEHGYVSRQFKRRYVLPKGHDIDKLESKLSSDGVLTITAPKISTGKEESRPVAIQHTGQPSVPIVQKSVKEEKKDEKKK